MRSRFPPQWCRGGGSWERGTIIMLTILVSHFLHLSDAEADDQGTRNHDNWLCSPMFQVLVSPSQWCKDRRSGKRETMIVLTYDVKSSFLHLSDAVAEDQGNEEPWLCSPMMSSPRFSTSVMQRRRIIGTRNHDYAHLWCQALVSPPQWCRGRGSGERGAMIMLTYDVKSSFLHLSDPEAEDQGNEELWLCSPMMSSPRFSISVTQRQRIMGTKNQNYASISVMQRQGIMGTRNHDYAHLWCQVLVFPPQWCSGGGSGERGTQSSLGRSLFPSWLNHQNKDRLIPTIDMGEGVYILIISVFFQSS